MPNLAIGAPTPCTLYTIAHFSVHSEGRVSAGRQKMFSWKVVLRDRFLKRHMSENYVRQTASIHKNKTNWHIAYSPKRGLYQAKRDCTSINSSKYKLN